MRTPNRKEQASIAANRDDKIYHVIKDRRENVQVLCSCIFTDILSIICAQTFWAADDAILYSEVTQKV